MGGYEQDQLCELQALEAIYPDELTGKVYTDCRIELKL